MQISDVLLQDRRYFGAETSFELRRFSASILEVDALNGSWMIHFSIIFGSSLLRNLATFALLSLNDWLQVLLIVHALAQSKGICCSIAAFQSPSLIWHSDKEYFNSRRCRLCPFAPAVLSPFHNFDAKFPGKSIFGIRRHHAPNLHRHVSSKELWRCFRKHDCIDVDLSLLAALSYSCNLQPP